MQTISYRNDLDFYKGIALIAVVLYHANIVQSGYLGVELFFVISGFLIIPNIWSNISKSKGISYYPVFLRKRLIRFWPLIILASSVCLLIGYFVGMLPDDFENLSESVVASNLMSNNLLSAITIRDYWSVRTSFQPLMHLWYVGILFEFYLIVPLVLYIIKYVTKRVGWDFKKSCIGLLTILSILSLLVYLSPSVNEASRFNHLQSRFYEIAGGGILALAFQNKNHPSKGLITSRTVYFILALSLLFCLYISLFDSDYVGQGTKIIPIGATKAIQHCFLIFNRRYLLLIVVVLSILIVNTDGSKWLGRIASVKNPICMLGKMSLSIYVWHQIYLAFERYFFSSRVTFGYMILFLFIVLVISWMTYQWIERKIAVSTRNLVLSAITSACVSGVAYHFYNNAGVVRDVPELNVSKNHVMKKMHSQYLIRTTKVFNTGFKNNGKYNICAIGNSFMKDFVNILKESSYSDSVNIYMNRSCRYVNPGIFRNADYVFIFGDPDKIPAYVFENIDKERIYGIGTKNFGDSNGVIYRKRHSPEYFNQSFQPHKEYKELNDLWAKKWGTHYINLFEMSLLDNGETRIFTPDHKYMSQDCEHLTQAGAQFFAKKIDFSRIIKKRRKESHFSHLYYL